MNILVSLRNTFEPILREIAPDPSKVPDFLAMIKPSQDPTRGDYQANFAMPLAKQLKQNPREFAAEIAKKIPLGDWLDEPEVAGPGFINLRLKSEWLARSIQTIATDERLGVPLPEKPLTVVIDFSGPNVAKPLHVGHLRSTIIGDSLRRLLSYLGHRVIGDNHLGDWGTQFGMLLYGYKNLLRRSDYDKNKVGELSRLYIEVRRLTATFDALARSYHKLADPDALQADPIVELARVFPKAISTESAPEDEDGATEHLPNPIAAAYRQETVKLHAGDAENLALWREWMPACMEEIHQIYRRLDVHFDHEYGESHYDGMLAEVIEELVAQGIAEESKSALIVRDGERISLVRKSDGASTYTTTDLATIKYRVQEWSPDKVLYVVDFRQGDHFKILFATARQWGYSQPEFTHVSFGSVLGRDGKPIKTREGGAITLMSLLDEAVRVAGERYDQTCIDRLRRGQEVPEVDEAERTAIAEAVGIGAVKYADLSQNRTSDYKFDYDKMLATDGNTATYMQYAYARCRSIFRKGEIDETRFRTSPPLPTLESPYERALALQLLRFPEALEAAAEEYLPHLITGYLWDLAKTYSGFFDHCPVLKAKTSEQRDSRLLLCDLTASVIRASLELLGIRTLERM